LVPFILRRICAGAFLVLVSAFAAEDPAEETLLLLLLGRSVGSGLASGIRTMSSLQSG